MVLSYRWSGSDIYKCLETHLRHGYHALHFTIYYPLILETICSFSTACRMEWNNTVVAGPGGPAHIDQHVNQDF